jgi:O-acetyl-ADP-ribose deacetylase (regulator of RNase III)
MTFNIGSLFESQADVLAHQVNCMGIMGGGIALQIKERWPMVFQVYKRVLNEKGPEACMGKCQLVQLSDVAIANLFGQFDFGTDKQYTDYKALRSAFFNLKTQMAIHNLKTVAFPDMIGCGLAGGDRGIVLPLIEEFFPDAEFWKV